MSLPLQWREWVIPLMRYGASFTDIGHTGRSEEAVRLRQEDHREHHDEQDGHAGKCEGASALNRHHLARSTPMTGSHGSILASAPTLSERRHRGLARRLVTVRRPAASLRAGNPEEMETGH
jgi:hypothetical protein